MPLPFRAVVSAVHLRQEDTLSGIVPSRRSLSQTRAVMSPLPSPQLFIPIMGRLWIRKLPLLRSMKAVSKQALRVFTHSVMQPFTGNLYRWARTGVLVDKKFYLERIDLMLAEEQSEHLRLKARNLKTSTNKRQGLPLYAGSEYRAL